MNITPLSVPTCTEYKIYAELIDPQHCIECPSFDGCPNHKHPKYSVIPGLILAGIVLIFLYALKIALF